MPRRHRAQRISLPPRSIQIPVAVLLDQNISDPAFRLYAYIIGYSWEDGSCRLNNAQLADQLGCSRQYVSRLLGELSAGDLVADTTLDGYRVLCPILDLDEASLSGRRLFEPADETLPQAPPTGGRAYRASRTPHAELLSTDDNLNGERSTVMSTSDNINAIGGAEDSRPPRLGSSAPAGMSTENNIKGGMSTENNLNGNLAAEDNPVMSTRDNINGAGGAEGSRPPRLGASVTAGMSTGNNIKGGMSTGSNINGRMSTESNRVMSTRDNINAVHEEEEEDSISLIFKSSSSSSAGMSTENNINSGMSTGSNINGGMSTDDNIKPVYVTGGNIKPVIDAEFADISARWVRYFGDISRVEGDLLGDYLADPELAEAAAAGGETAAAWILAAIEETALNEARRPGSYFRKVLNDWLRKKQKGRKDDHHPHAGPDPAYDPAGEAARRAELLRQIAELEAAVGGD